MSQRDLRKLLWLKPGDRSVAYAVVIRNKGDWILVTGIEWYKPGAPGYDIPVDVVMVVPNLMLP